MSEPGRAEPPITVTVTGSTTSPGSTRMPLVLSVIWSRQYFWYRKSALQGHDLAIEKCKELGVDLNAPTIDRETRFPKL